MTSKPPVNFFSPEGLAQVGSHLAAMYPGQGMVFMVWPPEYVSNPKVMFTTNIEIELALNQMENFIVTQRAIIAEQKAQKS